VYHGTGASFDQFDTARIGSANDPGKLGLGFYFTEHSGWADGYAGKSDGANVMPVYLALKNPLEIVTRGTGGNVWDALEALSKRFGIADPPAFRDKGMAPNPVWAEKFTAAVKAEGHDGVVLDYASGQREFVTFDPGQVKSSIGNSGRFDPTSGSLTDHPFTDWQAHVNAAIADMRTEMEGQRNAAAPPPRPAAEATAQPKAADAPGAVRAAEPARAEPGQGPGAADAPARLVDDAAASRVAQIAVDHPDLMVQLDGMEKPMRLADVLAAVKAEADDMKLDGDLMQAAAECALMQGA